MNISGFLESNPDLNQFIFRTEGKTSKWGRVVCEWKEKKTGMMHLFTPLINLKTGEMYWDCSKKLIHFKFIFHTILRPIHLAIKTIYHAAFFISIPEIIYSTIKRGKVENLTRKEIAKKCVKNSVKSLADIVLTPLYGVVMTIVSLTALIIGPLAPKTLYTFREITGKLVKSLYWQEKKDYKKDIFPCFQPYTNLQTIDTQHGSEVRTDTIYRPGNNKYERGLNNWVAKQIEFRRNFKFCGLKSALDPNTKFVSATFEDVRKTAEAEGRSLSYYTTSQK